MENTEYYTELTGDFMESQCMQDLRNGKIIITDVPFKFRDSNAYSSAHKFARGIVDENERCWRLWKLMECLESDIANIRIAQEIKFNMTNKIIFVMFFTIFFLIYPICWILDFFCLWKNIKKRYSKNPDG